MKVVLLLLAIALGALALWAIGMFFVKKRPPKKPPEKEPWEESLQQTMQSRGTPEPYVIANATHTIALCLAALSRRIQDFNASTERLGKINLLLACIIAVATMAYALAAWLQVR